VANGECRPAFVRRRRRLRSPKPSVAQLLSLRGAIRPAIQDQAALYQNLDRNGTRLTVIADRAGMTKQSMVELIGKAEALGLVERRSDPTDGRAKIVFFTPPGLELLAGLRRAVTEAERRMASAIGKPFLDLMKGKLAAYIDRQDPGAAQVNELKMSDGNAAWRTRNVGRPLNSASHLFARDVLRIVHENGFETVTEAQLALFRNLDLAGTRLTEIATRARMTKPAMVELVDKAERLGLVRRRDDPDDQRAKIVGFTPSGLRLLESARLGVVEGERCMASITGVAFIAEMKAQLSIYIRARAASAHASVDGSASTISGLRKVGS
jgi:DNA-binding MarR family transcriptional regulator